MSRRPGTSAGAASRAARRLALALVVALCVMGSTLAAGCGGDSAKGSGELRWDKRPRVIVPPDLPGDRIMTGTVRNYSLKPIYVVARQVRLRTAKGRYVKGAVMLLSSFLHGLYSPTQYKDPRDAGGFEASRTGAAINLGPGQTMPLTVSWHQPDISVRPARIEYGGGESLPVPR